MKQERKKIREFILKVSSRCNLNCSYCYVYNKGDFTYLKQPKFMSDAVVDHLLGKIQQHVINNEQSDICFIFHGGEPLLADYSFYEKFISKSRDILPAGLRVSYYLQTNGVLLDDEWCHFLTGLGIKVGISIDGTREVHDKFRLYHSGKGSFDDVVKGVETLKKYQQPSLISVINIESDPIDLYESIKQLGLSRFRILLPDATYNNCDSQLNFDQSDDNAPYGDWLIRLYTYWQKDNSAGRLQIPFFQSIGKLILGDSFGDEGFGRTVNATLSIQTDGSYEAHDVLKICGDGFSTSGFNVFNNEIDDFLNTDLADIYYRAHSNLCHQCLACPVVNVCGGGFVAHRYSGENGFDNPSVYCKDLMKVITFIQNSILDSLPADIAKELGLESLKYATARKILREVSSLNPM